MFGRASIRNNMFEWSADSGGINGSIIGGFHSLSSCNCGTPSCKNSIGSSATVSSPYLTWKLPVLVNEATGVASTSCSLAKASKASTSSGFTAIVMRS